MKKLNFLSGGRRFSAVIDRDYHGGGLTISIYDQQHMTETKFQPHGQMASSYYLDTFMKVENGLNLHGGVPAWQLTAEAVKQVQQWVETLWVR